MLPISHKQLYFLLLFFIGMAGLTYINRLPTGDDAWFAEQSYWFQKEGVIRSEYFRGLLGWEDQILVSHKLFLIFGAGLIYLFGHELPVIQLTGFIFFCIIVLELFFYLYEKEQKLSSWYLLAIFVLVFSNRLLVKMSFQNRPEMMLAALGLGSFLLLRNKETSGGKVALAGVLAGMAFLCHLNGIIYLIGGFGLLIYTRSYRKAMLFGVVGGLTSLFYFVDVIAVDNGFYLWYKQFSADPATQNAFGFSSKLWQLLTYPRMFVHSPEQLALTLLLGFLLWHQRQNLKRLPINLRVYGLLIFFSFWVITKGNSALYMILFIPFMLLLVYELYHMAPFTNRALKWVLVVYLAIGTFGMGQLIYANFKTGNLPVAYENLQKYIPDNKVGFVPLTFFFNEYDDYKRLLTHENYMLHFGKKGLTTAQMAKWAYHKGAGFIVMDYKHKPEKYYPKGGTKFIPHFKLAFYDGRFGIYTEHKNKTK